MTKANQNVGFDPGTPILRGTDQTILAEIEVEDITLDDWLASTVSTYTWYQQDPREVGSAQTAVLTVLKAAQTFATSETGISVTIPIADTATASLDAKVYYHELKLTSLSGLVDFAFTGFFKLTADG